MNIFVAQINAVNSLSYNPEVWRVASGYYKSGSSVYDDRIIKAPRFSRSIRSSLIGGRASQGYGELILANADHSLDSMRDSYFDGRTCTIWYGDQSVVLGSMQKVLIATVQSIAFEGDTVSVRLRDPFNKVERVFSDAQYGGTNVLPNGVDGTNDDIKGQYRPRPLGLIAHMPLTCVNTSLLIYEVSCRQCDYVTNVFDSGAYLGRGSDYSSLSDMYANQPSQGAFRSVYTLGGTYIRLGSTPLSQPTACVAEKWTHTQISAGGILSRMFSELGWSSVNDYVLADMTALNQVSCGPLGLLAQQGETIASLLDRIAGTVGAWWGFDALSRLRVARLDAPSSPSATLTDDDLRNPEGQANEDEIPCRITIPSDWNYAVQQKASLAGVVQQNAARVAWYEAETRDQKAEDSAIKDYRLTSVEARHDGYFAAISQAQAEATRRVSLLGPRRDVVTATVDDYLSRSIDIGTCVAVQSDELGYSTARNMIVVGIDVDLDENTADLELWG